MLMVQSVRRWLVPMEFCIIRVSQLCSSKATFRQIDYVKGSTPVRARGPIRFTSLPNSSWPPHNGPSAKPQQRRIAMYGVRHHHIVIVVVLVAIGVLLWFLFAGPEAL